MKMSRQQILTHGAHVRAAALANYSQFGSETGAKLARRYVFEMGEVMSDVHGRADAAAILYSIADAVANQAPIDDFILKLGQPVPAPAVDENPASPHWAARIGKIAGAICNALTDRFFLGFILGLVMGGLK